MAYKPNSEPYLDAKSLAIIDEIESEIDQGLLARRGERDHYEFFLFYYDGKSHISNYKVSREMIAWIGPELVKRYKEAGWLFVTVYDSAEEYSYKRPEKGYRVRDTAQKIFFSQKGPLEMHEANNMDLNCTRFLRKCEEVHLFGDPFKSTKKTLGEMWRSFVSGR